MDSIIPKTLEDTAILLKKFAEEIVKECNVTHCPPLYFTDATQPSLTFKPTDEFYAHGDHAYLLFYLLNDHEYESLDKIRKYLDALKNNGVQPLHFHHCDNTGDNVIAVDITPILENPQPLSKILIPKPRLLDRRECLLEAAQALKFLGVLATVDGVNRMITAPMPNPDMSEQEQTHQRNQRRYQLNTGLVNFLTGNGVTMLGEGLDRRIIASPGARRKPWQETIADQLQTCSHDIMKH